VDSVKVGDRFTSRKGAAYEVVAADASGFTIKRVDGHRRKGAGTLVRIGWKRVESARARLRAGEVLKFQAHAKDGGISYTVAVSVGVIYALREMVVEGETGWQLKV